MADHRFITGAPDDDTLMCADDWCYATSEDADSAAQPCPWTLGEMLARSSRRREAREEAERASAAPPEAP